MPPCVWRTWEKWGPDEVRQWMWEWPFLFSTIQKRSCRYAKRSKSVKSQVSRQQYEYPGGAGQHDQKERRVRADREAVGLLLSRYAWVWSGQGMGAGSSPVWARPAVTRTSSDKHQPLFLSFVFSLSWGCGLSLCRLLWVWIWPWFNPTSPCLEVFCWY